VIASIADHVVADTRSASVLAQQQADATLPMVARTRESERTASSVTLLGLPGG
jgi:hypothetical protein